MIQLCYLMVFISGATGLIYQVTWQKYLSVLLGSHAAATSIILALFFLFLSLGYAVLGRFANRFSRNNLALYGIFEFIIGLYAFYSPMIFRHIFDAYLSLANSGGRQDYFYGMIFCSLFIFIPTFFMGGTIPVLVQALSASYQVSSKVHARIYALNTIGAFLGCVAAGFYFIEKFGLEDTLLITGWINILVAACAFLIIYKTKESFSGPDVFTEAQMPTTRDRMRRYGLIGVSFLSGFYVFSIEKIIIRMAGLVHGSSVYTYSIVVGAFILAIGIGSYLLSINEKKLNEKMFIYSLILSLISLMALYLFVPYWSDVAFRFRIIFQPSLINFRVYWIAVLMFSLLIFIIPAGLLGTNLPFLFTLIRKENSRLAQMVGRLYSINCLGATVGAVVGGYWFFLFFDADTVFRISIVALMIAALIAAFTLNLEKRFRQIAVTTLCLLLTVNFLLPRWDIRNFVPGRHLITSVPSTLLDTNDLVKQLPKDEILFSKYDPNTYVTVTRDLEKELILYVNGKPDAATSGDPSTRALAALNPLALKPGSIKNIFVAGLGAGLSAALASRFKEVEKVTVAEISEGVKDALPYFDSFNYEISQRRQKLNIEVGDAYKVLMSKQEKYDFIVCEPSNPWVSGVEKLFSTEFYTQVRAHLNEDGLFAQWFPLFAMDLPTFLTILNTYSQSFPWVSVWSAGGGALTILGSEKPLNPDLSVVTRRFEEQKDAYKKFRINDPLSIYGYQLLTPAQVKLLLLKVSDVNSVFAPILEFKAARGQFANLNVDLSQALNSKALLPLPDELRSEVWPYWKEQNLPYSKTAAMDVVSSTSQQNQFHLLRYHLLWAENSQYQKDFPEAFKGLADHMYLLGKGPLKSGPPDGFIERVRTLSASVRQLQALGFKPKLGSLTDYIEKNCKENTCDRARFIFVSWFLTPSKWRNDFSKYNVDKLSVPQIENVKSEYQKIIGIYRQLGAF